MDTEAAIPVIAIVGGVVAMAVAAAVEAIIKWQQRRNVEVTNPVVDVCPPATEEKEYEHKVKAMDPIVDVCVSNAKKKDAKPERFNLQQVTNPIVYGCPSNSDDEEEAKFDLKHVTNPVVYACPCDSDEEEDSLKPKQHALRPQQIQLKTTMKHEPDLITKYLEKEQEHYEKLKKMRREMLDKYKKKEQEKIKKMQETLMEESMKWQERDEEFEEEIQEKIARTREMAEEAIKADRKKRFRAERERKKQEERARLASIYSFEEYKKHTAAYDDYQSAHIKEKVERNPWLQMFLYGERIKIKRLWKQLQYNNVAVIQLHAAIRNILLAAGKYTSQDRYEYLIRKAVEDFWSQACTEVWSSVALEASHFYGKIAFLLCWETPMFYEYLMAELYMRCPYMIPKHYDEPVNSTIRQDDEYDQVYQMAYVIIFGAMSQTGHGPVGVEQGWYWLSRTCNVPTRQITPALVFAFLDIAGGSMLEAGGRHMPNLLLHILTDVLRRVKDCEGSGYIRELRWHIEHYFSAV